MNPDKEPTTAQVIDVLQKARGLLHNKGWTQHTMARSAAGAVTAFDIEATRFCASGAVHRAVYDAFGCSKFGGRLIRAGLDELNRDVPAQDIVRWNDAPGRKCGEVLAVFDATVARLRQEAP